MPLDPELKGRHVSSRSDRLVNLLSVVVLILTVVVVFGPTGPIGARVVAWHRQRQSLRIIRASLASLDSVAQRLKGPAREPTLFEFADYECPYCRASYPAVEAWNAAHPGEQIAFLHFPLSIHPAAEGAARSVLCAGESAVDSAMHAYLMTSSGWERDTNWMAIAARVGVPDTLAFRKCLHSDRITQRLARTEALAVQLGVTGTPTFVSSKGRIPGATSAADLETLR